MSRRPFLFESERFIAAGEADLSAEAIVKVRAGMAEMSKVYDGAEGALAPGANERSENNPDASYIWVLVIGSMIDTPSCN